MTPIASHQYLAISGGRATPPGVPPDDVILPTHFPTPTCPVFRPPPES